MSINTSSNNQLYQIYRNAGPTPALIVPAFLFLFFGYAGVLMNASVVFVTVRTKSLHGTANFLLALISTFEVLHQSGHAIFFGIAVSGINFISNYLSARLELLMAFGLNCSLFGMACAAFDRLFAVIAPYVHKRLNKVIYLGGHTLACAIYGIRWCYVLIVYYTWMDPNSPTTGCISELLEGPVGEVFFRDSAILNGTCVLLYATLGIVIRYKKATKETTNRLLKSLVIILVVNIGAYFVTLGVYQILFHIPPDSLNPITSWHIGFISGVLLNICAGCNAIVLYKSSTDYRKAYKLHLSTLLLKLGSKPPSSWAKPQRTTQVNPKQSNNGSGGRAIASINVPRMALEGLSTGKVASRNGKMDTF